MDMPQGTPEERRTYAASRYDVAAAELERAAQQLRITAQHFRDGEVPRGCAHAFAALEHISTSEGEIKAMAELHASASRM